MSAFILENYCSSQHERTKKFVTEQLRLGDSTKIKDISDWLADEDMDGIISMGEAQARLYQAGLLDVSRGEEIALTNDICKKHITFLIKKRNKLGTVASYFKHHERIKKDGFNPLNHPFRYVNIRYD